MTEIMDIIDEAYCIQGVHIGRYYNGIFNPYFKQKRKRITKSFIIKLTRESHDVYKLHIINHRILKK